MSEQEKLTRGDQFVAYPDAKQPVFILVNRVAWNGSWADIRCLTWALSWSKRQPLPMPDAAVPQPWTLADVEATAPDA